MNGNIFNYSLASEQYMLGENCWWFGWDCSPYYAYAIPPAPPGNISTITGEPIFTQLYINAYNTAFNQQTSGYNLNYQRALNNYNYFTYSDVNSSFVTGTFGYDEEYNNNNGEIFRVEHLADSINNFIGPPYLFVSAGFRWRIWIYVFRLDNSNIWSTLCCSCILKIVKKLARGIVTLLWRGKVKES